MTTAVNKPSKGAGRWPLNTIGKSAESRRWTCIASANRTHAAQEHSIDSATKLLSVWTTWGPAVPRIGRPFVRHARCLEHPALQQYPMSTLVAGSVPCGVGPGQAV